MKYMYNVMSRLPLPPNASSPLMDNRQMAQTLNDIDEQGWEFVSYAQTRWTDGTVQEWWIFRREAK